MEWWQSLLVSVFTGSLGVAIVRWFLTKPRVGACFRKGAWYYRWRQGTEATGITIIIVVALDNKGNEACDIPCSFVLLDAGLRGGQFVAPMTTQHLDGNAYKRITAFRASIPREVLYPATDQSIHGDLVLTPIGNRRLLLGKKHLRLSVSLEHQEAEAIEDAWR